MTVALSTRKSGPWTATAGQTVFNYGFPVDAASELRVLRLRDGVEAPLELDVDYGVTGVGGANGTIILTSGATEGDVLTIDGELPLQRIANFPGFRSIPDSAIDKELDRMMKALQEMRRDVDSTIKRVLAGQVYDFENHRLINVADPVDDSDAATKGWANNAASSTLAAANAAAAAAAVSAAEAAASVGGLVLEFLSRADAVAADPPETIRTIRVRQSPGIILEYHRDDAGTALETAGGAKWSPDGPVYVDHFGENVTPGTTDMAPAAQAAVDWLGDGGVLKYLDGARYRQDTTIEIPHDNFTVDRGTSIIDISNLTQALVGIEPDPAFKILGTKTAETTLAAAVAAFAMSVTVTSSAGMQVGDPIHMMSDNELWYMDDANLTRRHIVNRIAGIAGNVVQLAWPATMSLSVTGYAVTVVSWTGAKNFKAIGQGPMYGGGVRGNLPNGQGAAAFYLRYADYADIEVGYLEGFQGYAVKTSFAMDVDTHDGVIRGLAEDYDDAIVEGQNSGFYGVRYDDGFGGSIRNVKGRRCRHLQDGARWEKITIQDCAAQRTHRPPFGSHYGCTDFTYISNRGNSQNNEGAFVGGGIEWRGHSVTAIGNDFYNPAGLSPWFYDTAGSVDDIPRKYIMLGNTGVTGRMGVSLNANIGFLEMLGNDIQAGQTGETGYPGVDIATLDLGTARVSGGRIKMGNGFHCVRAANTTPRTRDNISVEDARLTGYGTQPVRFYSTKNVVYRNNKLDGSHAALTDGGNGGAQIMGPNFAADGSLVGAHRISWTPVLTDGTNAATASAAVGYLTLAGGLAHINGRLTISSLASASGSVKITGLPTALVNLVNGYEVVDFVVTGAALGATERIVQGRIAPNAKEIILYGNKLTSGASALQASEVGAAADIFFSGTFAVA